MYICTFLFDFWGGRSHRRSRRGDVQDVSVCGVRPRADVYFEQSFVLALCTISPVPLAFSAPISSDVRKNKAFTTLGLSQDTSEG